MTRAFVIGNGPSLLQVNLDLIEGERSYGVNRIWRLWKNNWHVTWRPTDYVRCEHPRSSKTSVEEDLREIGQTRGIKTVHLERGMRYTWQASRRPNVEMHAEWITACIKRDEHDWHLPQICSYGTVVTVAIQVAILDGADEICLLGCDLDTGHFYDTEPFINTELAYKAHLIAARCSPVPIYNCSPGKLDMYPRATLEERIQNVTI